MKSLIIAVAAALLAGCSTTRSADAVADCTLPVARNAGMGVTVESCASWTFGARFRGPMVPAAFPMGAAK